MKEIPLTQGKVALVDDDDFEWLNQWKWYAHKSSRTWYAHRLDDEWPNQKTIAMHCQISVNGNKTHSFHASAEEAAREYDKKAKEFFGKFAKLNFPEGET